ncbi:MAG: ATP-binding protein [Paludibacteraceae bacterium]|nr:ATP-binding protein [Paludibacteraceae bacterium]
MGKYRKRIADKLLQYNLEEMGAVLVKGPKWCGKTTTCEQQAKSVIYMDDPKMKEQYVMLANTQVELLLNGEKPRLIDEWQVAPKIWDTIRFNVDHNDDNKDGQYILTGSTVPPDENDIEHTGTGRFAELKMRTMSLYESGDSTGEVSLEDLFQKAENISGSNPLDLARIAYLICRGGWPGSLKKSERASLRIPYHYFDILVQKDISHVDNVKRNPEWAAAILRSYARLQGSQASINVIEQDVKNLSSSLSESTIENYLDALRKLFVVEDLLAWSPNLRSKTAIRTSPTRYVVDPSIAIAAMGVGPEDLLGDLNTMGFLFETLAIRDLRVYAESLDGTVYHYRDKTELECDAVIHLRNRKIGLIEIKLGGEKSISEGANTLKALANRLDITTMKEPSFLMVLTAVGQFAYRRDDGVFVVPIGCLRP